MELYNLGKIPWDETQLIYHSLALLGREALCLVSPASPYVCVGFHQDVAQEVDLDFCRSNNLPVFRREVGGGAVFLDGNQLFYQLILKSDNPIVPKGIDAFYKKFLTPVIDVHHRIGIQAAYKPVNDIIVNDCKISGTGVGEIGDCIVFVGNLIIDFDYETMARVLRIPDEKFRDKVKKTMEENLTTIRRELGKEKAARWDESALNDMLAEVFGELTGPLVASRKDSRLETKMNELRSSMMHNDWLFHKGKRVDGRVVKIKSGLEVVQKIHKAVGGLIRTEFYVDDGRYKEVSISGDYFCFPNDVVNRLQKTVEGSPTDGVQHLIMQFYDEQQFQLPGIDIEDWIRVFSV